MKPTRILKVIITLLFIIALVFYLKSIDWNLLLKYFNKARSIIYLTILLAFTNLTIKIYRLKIIASSGIKKITIMESAFAQSSSIFLAVLTPARVGEFSKIYFLNKKGISLTYSIFSLFAERSLDILILVIGSFFFIQNYISLTNLGWGLLISLIVIILLIYVFLFYFGGRVKSFFLKKKFSFLNKPIIKNVTIRSFLSEVHFPKNKFVIVPALIATILAWIIEAAISWIVLLSLGINLNFFVAVAIICISAIASLFSILPFGLGSFDFSYAYLMMQSSVPKEAAFFALIWLRLLEIIVLSIVIAVSLRFQGANISKLKRIKVA